MNRTSLLVVLSLAAGLFSAAIAQNTQDLSYFLPNPTTYDPAVPRPADVLGFEVGEWHVTHDQALAYYRTLAEKSERVTLEVIGYTHERRPLISLIISSPENQQRLPEIKAQRKQWIDPAQLGARPPLVVWLGYSIHGNEPSGANAALLVAYHLAAAQDAETAGWLRDMVILIDPFQNPDGLQRFAGWANSHKSLSNAATSPLDIEHLESWPNGRTNHYWFDLNRDWLPATQPESQARLAWFHTWMPNLLTDHHEMGSNSTFFFQPGVPSRNHPLTPLKVFEFTRDLGTYHAKALDAIGSRYFTEQEFDDFYYGKGSTYPDLQGGIGILFEQASSRGYAQETTHGLLTFPFTIRNQVAVSFSSLKGAYARREAWLDWQKTFFQTATEEAKKDPARFIAIGGEDPQRTEALAGLLRLHQIRLHRFSEAFSAGGYRFEPGTSYLIPLEQPQYRLIQAMFERRTRFQDSLFYDVSSWTLPLAYGVKDATVAKTVKGISLLPDQPLRLTAGLKGPDQAVSYAFSWKHLNAPVLLGELLRKDLKAYVATRPFSSENLSFTYGDIVIPAHNQAISVDELKQYLNEVALKYQVEMHALPTGYTGGFQLGSAFFQPIKQPNILMVADEGISGYDAGAIWHSIDQRLRYPVAKVSFSNLSRVKWSDYTVLILPDGRYDKMPQGISQTLTQWVNQGGVVVALGNALSWAKMNNLSDVQFTTAKIPEPATDSGKPALSILRESLTGAQEIGGAICQAVVDRTHPLGYGLTSDTLFLMRSSTLFIDKPSDVWSSPILYAKQPLVSGYISPANLAELPGRPAAIIKKQGQGRIIGLPDDLIFRAFWLGSSHVFWNAVFFGTNIR